MTNGFEIQITEGDFKAKPVGEQNWILFQGVTAITKCIDNIHDEGCDYAKKKRKLSFLKILSAISGGITFALGVIYILYQLTCR